MRDNIDEIFMKYLNGCDICWWFKPRFLMEWMQILSYSVESLSLKWFVHNINVKWTPRLWEPQQTKSMVLCRMLFNFHTRRAQFPLISRSVFSFRGYSLDDLVFCVWNIFLEYIETSKCVIPKLKYQNF